MPETAEALAKRQGELRKQVAELLNMPDSGKVAKAETLKKFRHGNADVHELKYGLLGLSSYLILPDEVDSSPIAVFLHKSRSKEGALESQTVDKLLAAGTAVLAIDSVPFEETAYLLGTSPTAYNVSHVLESVDLLARSYNVEAKLISCIGEVDDVALLTALLDERISSVVVASAGGSQVSRQGNQRHGTVPGLQAVTTRTELLAMLAPRELCIETQEAGQEQIEEVYRLAGARDKLHFAAKPEKN